MKRSIPSRQFAAISGSWLVRTALAVTVAGSALLISRPAAIFADPATAPASVLTVGGACTFSGKDSTWSAKLTPKGNNVYDADYSATWGGKPLSYKGTIKSDWKTDITGDGTNANGTFEFTGKFGDDGVAKCSYKETGGRGRNGTMTVKAPAAN